jgi:3-oxoacyl-[acyl-carrier protein] reductase
VNDQPLDGRRCAVTGASSGIGAAIARALAARGAAVVGLARRFPRPLLDVPLRDGQIVEVHLDVTDDRAVDARFAEIGDVDALINAAGSGAFGPLVRAGIADLRALLDVHVVGTFACCRAALRSMQVRRSGHIVNLLSIAAVRVLADCGAYGAAKAGQRALSRVLAEEVRASGIRVTDLLVGAVDTPLWDRRPGFDRDRMMRPEYVAGVVADVLGRGGAAVEEITLLPDAGQL